MWIDPPWWTPKAPLLIWNWCAETKKYGTNETSGQSSKIELSNKEIDNLSDAQFKTLVIGMLTELVEYGRKIEEEVKAIQNELN